MPRPKKNDEDKKSVTLKTRVTKEELQKLDVIAEKMGTNRSQVIRMIIAEASNIVEKW